MSNPAVTDRILLRLSPDQSTGQRIFPWFGEWPPPDLLLLVIEEATDRYKVVNPDEQPSMDWKEFAKENGCKVLWFDLNRASEIDRPARPDENWFRGAEYKLRSFTDGR